MVSCLVRTNGHCLAEEEYNTIRLKLLEITDFMEKISSISTYFQWLAMFPLIFRWLLLSLIFIILSFLLCIWLLLSLWPNRLFIFAKSDRQWLITAISKASLDSSEFIRSTKCWHWFQFNSWPESALLISYRSHARLILNFGDSNLLGYLKFQEICVQSRLLLKRRITMFIFVYCR